MANPSLPADVRLPALEHHLARRFPGLEVSARIVRTHAGDVLQRVYYIGPVELIEQHGLATREFLASHRHYDGRFRPVLTECGDEVIGGQDDAGQEGTLLIFTTVETATEEHLPRWAEKAGEKIVRRLLKAR